MASHKSEVDQIKSGIAVIAACLVETLSDTDPTFRERFLTHLANAYAKVRDDSEGDVLHELELLSWVREMVSGFNPVTGQGKPYMQE